MALHVPKAPGVPQMLKEGARVSLSVHNQQFEHPLIVSEPFICFNIFLNLFKFTLNFAKFMRIVMLAIKTKPFD